MPELTPRQCRAARALIDWRPRKLAEKAGVEASTVKDFERGRASISAAEIHVLRAALESAGVAFIAENGGGAGVRLRKGGQTSDPAAAIPVEDLTSQNDE